MESRDCIPMLPKKEKAEWWGQHRLVEVGGPVSESDNGGDSSDDGLGDDADDAEATCEKTGTVDALPINYHQLPSVAHSELVWATSAKHVIDLTPSPALNAVHVLEAGGSYFGLCSTLVQKEWLQQAITAALEKRCAEVASPLHQMLFGFTSKGNDGAGGSAGGVEKNVPPAVVPGGGGGGGGGGAPPRKKQRISLSDGVASGDDGVDIAKMLAAAKARLQKNLKQGSGKGAEATNADATTEGDKDE
jgi:hypothetical protein